jgi:hypothetical protein
MEVVEGERIFIAGRIPTGGRGLGFIHFCSSVCPQTQDAEAVIREIEALASVVCGATM